MDSLESFTCWKSVDIPVMPGKRILIDKKIYKLAQGECRLCGEKDPSVLDVHRIFPGAEGGRYTSSNTVCLCCKCHRKVHDGQIIIGRYYLSYSGAYLLQIIEGGTERFI